MVNSLSGCTPGRLKKEYDAVVIGGGIMGSASAYELARRGQQVLLLEQFDFLHRKGSSHGESRIIRPTYPQVKLPPRQLFLSFCVVELQRTQQLFFIGVFDLSRNLLRDLMLMSCAPS